MSSQLKKVAAQAGIYAISTVFGRMITLITAPILTRIFNPEEFGIIASVQIAVTFAVIIAGMNLGSGLSYYYFHYDDEAKRKSVIPTGFALIVMFAVTISMVMFFGSSQISVLLGLRNNTGQSIDISQYLKIASLQLLFGLLMTASQSVLRLLQRPKSYLFVEILALSSNLMFILYLVIYIRLGISGVFWSAVIAALVGAAFGLFMIRDKLRVNINWTILLPILAFALPQLPGVLVNWAQIQVGRIFINYFANLEQQGLYSIAFALGSLLFVFTSAFRLAYDPFSLSIMKQENAKSMYATSYSVYSFVFLCLFAGLVSFSRPALYILTPAQYHDANEIVFWIAGAGFLMGANNILATGIWVTRRTSYTSYAQIGAFVIVVVSAVYFVPKYAAVGAAISYFLGALSQSLFYYIFAQRLYRIEYRYISVQVMLMASMLIAWLNSVLVADSDFLTSLGFGILTMLILIIPNYFITLNYTNRKIIKAYTKSVFNRKTIVGFKNEHNNY